MFNQWLLFGQEFLALPAHGKVKKVIQRVFIKVFVFLKFIYFLTVPWSMQDLSSTTKDWTCAPCIKSAVLNKDICPWLKFKKKKNCFFSWAYMPCALLRIEILLIVWNLKIHEPLVKYISQTPLRVILLKAIFSSEAVYFHSLTHLNSWREIFAKELCSWKGYLVQLYTLK